MEEELILKRLAGELERLEKQLKTELQAIRGNRPSVGLLEDIRVNYYGQMLPLKQLGSLAIRPPREIEINVWDKGAVGAVAKAIEETKAGFSVATDGGIVRVSLPPLTSERRAELEKLARRMVENARIGVRGARDEVIKEIREAVAEKKLSEDQMFRLKEKIQEAVDKANREIESLLETKLQELAE